MLQRFRGATSASDKDACVLNEKLVVNEIIFIKYHVNRYVATLTIFLQMKHKDCIRVLWHSMNLRQKLICTLHTNFDGLKMHIIF